MVMVPSIHSNGTSSDDLLNNLVAAMDAVADAVKALRATCPNGRDYYPQGDDAIVRAMREHEARAEKLESVRRELMEIAGSVAG